MVNHSYLSDLNADLVVAYNIIKTEPEKLINLLRKHVLIKTDIMLVLQFITMTLI